jgi:hypothetical protein
MHTTKSLQSRILMVLRHRRRHIIVLLEHAVHLGKPTERLMAEFERLRYLHRGFTEGHLTYLVEAIGAPQGASEVSP